MAHSEEYRFGGQADTEPTLGPVVNHTEAISGHHCVSAASVSPCVKRGQQPLSAWPTVPTQVTAAVIPAAVTATTPLGPIL